MAERRRSEADRLVHSTNASGIAELETSTSVSIPLRPAPLQQQAFLAGNDHLRRPQLAPPISTPAKPSNGVCAFRYLKRIENDLTNFSPASALQSRVEVLKQLLPRNSPTICSTRVALAGGLGMGKTYIAISCVHEVMERTQDMSILWISCATDGELEADCQYIADHLGFAIAPRNRPWDTLCAVIEATALQLRFPTILVLDGLRATSPDKREIEALQRIQKDTSILITTRDTQLASSFAGYENTKIIGCFEPSYAANALGLGCLVSESPVFMQTAQLLEYNPLIILRARDFLRTTETNIIDFTNQLLYILDENNWHRSGKLRIVAQDIRRRNTSCIRTSRATKDSGLFDVLNACLDPSWPSIFSQLATEQPAALELLSKLAVIGESCLPARLLFGSGSDTSSVNMLTNYRYLEREDGCFYCSKLMLIACRCWLISRAGMEYNLQLALEWIANRYPDADEVLEQGPAMEGVAKAITSETAMSWLRQNETVNGNLSMLSQKRRKLAESD
jgi:hypothetical protein